jgi:hypothetical protein
MRGDDLLLAKPRRMFSSVIRPSIVTPRPEKRVSASSRVVVEGTAKRFGSCP